MKERLVKYCKIKFDNSDAVWMHHCRLKTVMLFAHKTLKSGEIYQNLDFYALLFLFSLFLHKYLKHLETGFNEPQKTMQEKNYVYEFAALLFIVLVLMCSRIMLSNVFWCAAVF